MIKLSPKSVWQTYMKWTVTNRNMYALQVCDTPVYVQTCALLNWSYFRFRCGSGAVPTRFRQIEIVSLFHNVFRYLRTLHIVWSVVRRRVSRRLTRLQIVCNVLKYYNIFKTVRCDCGSVVVIFSIYLSSVLCTCFRFRWAARLCSDHPAVLHSAIVLDLRLPSNHLQTGALPR